MKYAVCYLILCHTNPMRIKEMIDFLSSEDAFFVIHVDKKSRDDFSVIVETKYVKFVPNRVAVTWGDISVVDAVNTMSAFAISNFPMANHFCLLSGADFPIKAPCYIQKYLSIHADMDFIQGILLPSKETGWLEDGRRRTDAYVLPLNAHSNATIEPKRLSIGNLRQLGKVVLNNVGKIPLALRILLTYPKRVKPLGMDIYAGEMWWILTKKTLVKILKWTNANPAYHRYFEDSQVPDEMYFNSLVWNLSKNVNSDIKRYISWVSKQDPSPRWLTYDRDRVLIEKIIDSSDLLFARKIEDSRLIEYVKEKLLETVSC